MATGDERLLKKKAELASQDKCRIPCSPFPIPHSPFPVPRSHFPGRGTLIQEKSPQFRFPLPHYQNHRRPHHHHQSEVLCLQLTEYNVVHNSYPGLKYSRSRNKITIQSINHNPSNDITHRTHLPKTNRHHHQTSITHRCPHGGSGMILPPP